MINKYSFFHNGECHYSAQSEPDAKIRQEKWEFLRTHKVKYFYETNEDLEMKFKELFESRKNTQGKVFLLPELKEVQKKIIYNNLVEVIDAAIYCKITLEELEELINKEAERLEREGVEPVKVKISVCEKSS